MIIQIPIGGTFEWGGSCGTFEGQRFGGDIRGVFRHGGRDFSVTGELDANPLGDFKVGGFTHVLDFIDELTGESLPNQLGAELGGESDQQIALGGDDESRLRGIVDENIGRQEFDGLIAADEGNGLAGGQ